MVNRTIPAFKFLDLGTTDIVDWIMLCSGLSHAL